jgi:anaerobic ribonucleoside-triphosphate reductase
MLKNPFETEEQTTKPSTEETSFAVDLEKTEQSKEENPPLDFVTEEPVIEKNEFASFEPLPEFNSNYTHTPITKQAKLDKREVKELSDEEYHERVKELNENAENKHYVLFFGSPASGKTWIIGSVLHYMKNYIGGVVYLQTDKTTESEEELFYQLQDRFNGIVGTKKLTSTDTKQYFEMHISFTPTDKSKPPIEIVFVDASGEHSEEAFHSRDKNKSGMLPNYLTAILESNVKTKIAFVYDQSLSDNGKIPQMNVLSEVFTKIQYIQSSQDKQFPKALLLSKADKIFAGDMAAVERNGYDPMLYALEKIPAFANSFFNESPNNKTIFYRMGKFSVNSDLLTEFDKECPEKFFNWLYKEGMGVSAVKELNCWDKFKRWFSGKA